MKRLMTQWVPVILMCGVLVAPSLSSAEVTKVTIASRAVVAGGQAFGATGAYEKLAGTIEFALDPASPHNRAIVDLDQAARAADGRVHFTADLFVLRPVDGDKGNGALLFEIANRGRKGLLGRFNRAPGSNDPTSVADMGDGFLMREGYTLVWVGWQFDVAPPFLRVEAPAVNVPGHVRMSFTVDERRTELTPADLPQYLPADPNDQSATLTVRDRFWATPTTLPRSSWRFAPGNGAAGGSPAGRPRLVLDGGFEPGRVYDVDYAATGARVAGVGMAAIRDAAAAFRHRTDLPVRGRFAYVFGISQSGRFLRQFLHDGFNADEQDRRAFDAVWPHIAGGGQGSFNERFAMPGYNSYRATRFPFSDLPQEGPGGKRDGILAAYRPAHLPKVVYTNTSVEYWGLGRAAALTHAALDGTRDGNLPENVRIYLLSGTQHGEAAFPPSIGAGQELANPTPQGNVMRALLRAMHQWASRGTAPPASRYPKLGDKTLAPVDAFRFPSLLGVSDPRTIEGPGQMAEGTFAALPFLVPQVDLDGNELAGIRVPEVSVPLATTTGWNFRAGRIGNPSALYPLLGSYIPFPRTRVERAARRDPRLSVDERYSGREEYLQRIRTAAAALVKDRFLLADDVPDVVQRATRHWDLAARATQTN